MPHVGQNIDGYVSIYYDLIKTLLNSNEIMTEAGEILSHLKSNVTFNKNKNKIIFRNKESYLQ